jgi:hypothetical protein
MNTSLLQTLNASTLFDPHTPEASARFAREKAVMLEALKARGIARVSMDYDGYADAGQIEHIAAYSAEEVLLPLDGEIILDFEKEGQPYKYPTLEYALDAFGWLILYGLHAHFEDNDGGFGDLVIDVASGMITLDHRERFTITITACRRFGSGAARSTITSPFTTGSTRASSSLQTSGTAPFATMPKASSWPKKSSAPQSRFPPAGSSPSAGWANSM